jgi:hypothetical protein
VLPAGLCVLAAFLPLAVEPLPPDNAPDDRGPLNIHGNVVIARDVYLSILRLPDDEPWAEATARSARQQILDFLHSSGYDLASVNATVVPGGLDIDINEGRLEKVVFRGRLTFQTLRFKLALSVPFDVFNRPSLDRQMRELAADLRMPRVWYEVIDTEQVKHFGPQLENLGALGTLQGLPLVQPQQPHELHVFFTEHEWDTGANLDIRSGSPDGLEGIVSYQGRDLGYEDDRFRVAASGGGFIRQTLSTGAYYATFTRAFGEIAWYTPPAFGSARLLVWLRSELLDRQRPDLNLEDYLGLTADGSFNLQLEPKRGLVFSFGIGADYDQLLGHPTLACMPSPPPPAPQQPCSSAVPVSLITPGPPPDYIAAEGYHLWAFGLLRADFIFDPENQRADRRHQLTLEGRYFLSVAEPQWSQTRLFYQKVFEFGWHDLWLHAAGNWDWGKVYFYREEPVSGRYLRGVFGAEFATRVAALSTEFRFSVTRDLYKISIFNDVAVWGHIDRSTSLQVPDTQQLRVGDSFGPGFHALIEGMFQLDMYLAFGYETAVVGSPSDFNVGVVVNLQKVF